MPGAAGSSGCLSNVTGAQFANLERAHWRGMVDTPCLAEGKRPPASVLAWPNSCAQSSPMTNLASALKSEVARLARKELRTETESLKKTVATQRSEIAALKRRTSELEKAVNALTRLANKAGRSAAPKQVDVEEGQFRFRAAGMASNRKRLGLSAEDFGLLVGTTGQSIYHWESGKSKPRPQNLAAIAALRGIGKREVAARLEALKKAA